MKLYLTGVLFLVTSIAQGKNMLVVEITDTSITLNGKEVSDLKNELNGLKKCEQIHLMVDKNTEHKKVVDLVRLVESVYCDKVSIQSF